MNPQPKRVTAAALSRASDYSKSSITRLTAEGVLQRDSDGRYDALASLKQIKQHEATRQQDGKRPIVPEIAALRQQYLQLKIDRLQFDLDAERGKYVLTAEVERDVELAYSHARVTLLRLPKSIGVALGAIAERKAEELVIEVLHQLEKDPLGEDTLSAGMSHRLTETKKTN
jgi:hypothetical protein